MEVVPQPPVDVEFIKLPGWRCAAPFLFVTSHTVEYLRLARSDQDSIRAAGVASILIRDTGVKEVMPGQTTCAAHIHMHKLPCPGAAVELVVPVTLQIPISTLRSVALWWRRLSLTHGTRLRHRESPPILSSRVAKVFSRARLVLTFTGVLDRMSIKLQSKLGDLMSVKAKLLRGFKVKGLQSVRDIDDPAHTECYVG
eukprot:1154043-Pelagomonas_calceolata.AAC.6